MPECSTPMQKAVSQLCPYLFTFQKSNNYPKNMNKVTHKKTTTNGSVLVPSQQFLRTENISMFHLVAVCQAYTLTKLPIFGGRHKLFQVSSSFVSQTS